MGEEENQAMESLKSPNPRKRSLGRNNINKKKKKVPQMKKKPRQMPELKPAAKIDRRMKNLIRKRARDYNSDDDEENEKGDEKKVRDFAEEQEEEPEEENVEMREASEEEDKELSGDDEEGELQPGITKLAEGCRAFRLAFKSIVKKAVNGGDLLGPVMSAQKKLMAEKLTEEKAEQNVKRQNRKKKRLMGEKGHVIPEKHLNSHEKFLISVATKGVVKLFNAVNKAQLAQKGLNPSRSKDEKALRKRRKEAFYSELKKKNSGAATVQASTSQADDEGPAWAPLRDNYMLTSSKLKDWDKMPERASTDDIERVLDDSSSDDE